MKHLFFLLRWAYWKYKYWTVMIPSWNFSVLFTENWLGNALSACCVGFFAICLILWGLPLFISHLLHGYLEQPMRRNKQQFSVVVLCLLKAGAVSLSPITNKIVADKSATSQLFWLINSLSLGLVITYIQSMIM